MSQPNKPFIALGPSIFIAADTSAPLGVQCNPSVANDPRQPGNYRISNSGSTQVSVGCGATAVEAQSNSVEPTAGTPQNSIVIAPGAVEIIRFAPNSFFSGYSSATANLYITPGDGI